MASKSRSYNQFLRQWQRLRPYAEFNIPEILSWADAQFKQFGRWPQARSGKVRGSLAEMWSRVDDALRRGRRGLEGRSSLAKLLWEKRGVEYAHLRRPLTEKQILAWADAHHERTGKWPTIKSGRVGGRESWGNLHNCLMGGLEGGRSLAKFLWEERGVLNRHSMRPLTIARILEWADAHKVPPLTPKQILAWADAHRKETGMWPSSSSGPVRGVPGEKWGSIDSCLRGGARGLPGGQSLVALLHQHRGAPMRRRPGSSGKGSKSRQKRKTHQEVAADEDQTADSHYDGRRGRHWARDCRACLAAASRTL
jgi:hypothetical protein